MAFILLAALSQIWWLILPALALSPFIGYLLDRRGAAFHVE
jgi:hypothetical protein